MAELRFPVPVLDFDIVQGQDLSIQISYVTEGVADTLDGAALKMEVRTTDYKTLIDTLTIANGRITITEPNNFAIHFPKAISSAYALTTPRQTYIYGLELTAGGVDKRLFHGAITVYREQTRL